MTESERSPVTDQLDELHTAVNQRHGRGRERLLAGLDTHAAPVRLPAVVWPRWLLGGMWLSAACLAAAVFFLATARPLSAMERMARAIEQVTSFTWRLESVSISTAGKGRRLHDVNVGRWRREPLGLHATMRSTETKRNDAEAPDSVSLLVDIEETHGAQRGILIDHRHMTYWWTPGLAGVAAPGNSPLAAIYKVRAHRGRELRDLGERDIEGRKAQGVEILLDDADPETESGPATPETALGQSRGWDWRNVTVEAWFDPETDLPIEFSMTRRGKDYVTTYRYTDLCWNLDFEADAFTPSVPDGYNEFSAPTE